MVGVNWKPADPRSLLAWTHFAVLWDVEPGSPLKQLPLNVGDGHPQAAFVQNGQQIVAFQALADGVQWRDISADAPTRTFPKGDISPACAAVSRDGKRLAYPHTANTIRICDVATGKSDASRAEPGLTLSGTPESLRALAFSPSGKLLAAGAANATAAVWDASSGRAVRTVRSSDSKATLRSIAFSPDETLLAAGGDDWTVHIWNLSAQDERRTLKGHTGQVASVAFSPGGELLASASYDGTVRLWDARTGAGTQVLTEHRSYVHEVSFSSDGRLLAAGAQDGALGLWRRTSDVKEGVQRAALPPKTERPTSKAKAPSEAVLPATAMVGEADVLALKPAYPGFFVLGTWGVGVRRDAFQRDKQAELDRVKQDLQRMKDLGINTAVANALYAPDEQPHTARLAHELGLKVIAINEGLAGIYKAKKPFTQNAATALVAQDAQRLKDSPNVLEHVVHLDPPEGHFKPQDWREMCAGSLEADSTRPPHFIYFEAGPAQPYWRIRPMPSIHYMVYPLMGARPRAQWAAHATQQFEQFRQLAPDASHFPWIQACGGRDGLTLPQPAELRAFTYLALAHGSKGVIFFCWHSKGFQALVDDQGQPTELGQEAKRLTAAIAQIGPVLMRLRVGPDIASVSANALAKTLVSEKGHAFVFVVNLDVAKAADVKVDIQPPAGQAFSGVRDVLEDRALAMSLSGGKLTFTARLEPGEGRLFRLCTAEAAPRSSAPFVYGYFLASKPVHDDVERHIAAVARRQIGRAGSDDAATGEGADGRSQSRACRPPSARPSPA